MQKLFNHTLHKSQMTPGFPFTQLDVLCSVSQVVDYSSLQKPT